MLRNAVSSQKGLKREPRAAFELVDSFDSSRAKFACDTVPAPGPQGPCPNQDVIDILTKLQEIHKIRAGIDDKFKVLSYSKSLRNIRVYPYRIRTAKEAMKIPGVGAKTADKIMEIIRTGTLRRLMHEYTPDVDVLWRFKGIYGVGTKTAQDWYNWGCRTLDDVANGKGGVKLNPGQKIGIKYYAGTSSLSRWTHLGRTHPSPDLQERMPREEVKELYDLIVPYGAHDCQQLH
ncbi:uncharacterized protein SCHCODRAFT_02671944 [Schizophyllum commune H4-8]|uniref:uncharacterized protein n=1 Tax=Schizophyllum commune (strain H4-8 / FGSC 9210) TaxID=578458 RepID=UPI00215E1CF5|nr:uncharacterized protein SCHCODRAFT_02671944 [Schizophyllum commune H4-8]KAI5888033.1 hypothetical protein SCHCODRAFT_02671944 [Schizophyllum commune H4-8]